MGAGVGYEAELDSVLVNQWRRYGVNMQESCCNEPASMKASDNNEPRGLMYDTQTICCECDACAVKCGLLTLCEQALYEPQSEVQCGTVSFFGSFFLKC